MGSDLDESVRKKNHNAKKLRVAVIVVGCVIAAVVLSILLWQSHLERLREKMETHLAQSVIYVGQGQNDLAYSEAEKASYLAVRLQDSDYEHIISKQLYAINSLEYGLTLFAEYAFLDAREAFYAALFCAQFVDGFDTRLVRNLIEITEEHILFEEMVRYGETLLEHSYYDDALTIFENALTVASSLSFAKGAQLVEGLIEETHQRIIEAKRVIAREYESRGDYLYVYNLFEQALEAYENALDI